MEKERVERIFSMFMYLNYNRNKNVEDLADMLGVNKSTIYRYIDLYKSLGFELSTEYGGVYRIVSFPKDFQRLFKKQLGNAAPCLGADIDAGVPCIGSTYEVLGEFRENSAYTKVPYLRRFTENANKLIKASKEKKLVILRRYENDETNCFCDRKVEPYDFGWYFNYLWAYDHKTMRNELFRVSQIGEVEILDQDWTEQKRHKKQKMDVFGTYGHTTTRVRLKLSMRAKNRLIAEHPMAVRVVKRIGDSITWEFDAGLCGYREVARFCLGFLNEVQILEGEGLEEHMIGLAEEQLRMAKEYKASRLMKMKARISAPTLPVESSARLKGQRKRNSGIMQRA